ncbi:hypothetical protein GOBAR_DD19260 [Gossypium barbadense]|nr:hypothetical protein GOBAR_DD19260 [Gossypium barbadense]
MWGRSPLLAPWWLRCAGASSRIGTLVAEMCGSLEQHWHFGAWMCGSLEHRRYLGASDVWEPRAPSRTSAPVGGNDIERAGVIQGTTRPIACPDVVADLLAVRSLEQHWHFGASDVWKPQAPPKTLAPIGAEALG